MDKQDKLAAALRKAGQESSGYCPASEIDWDAIAAAVRSFMGSAAARPWMKVGSFEPDPDALYLVQGTMRTSVKQGRDIDGDNVTAALIDLSAAIGEDIGGGRG